MNGQWIGQYEGKSAAPESIKVTGLAIINVDDCIDHYRGVAYFNDFNAQFISTASFFSTKNKENKFTLKKNLISPINPMTGEIDSWINLKKLYGDMKYSSYADVDGDWNEEIFTVKWKTELGAVGSCVLCKSRADKPSDYVPNILDWGGFKEDVAKVERKRFIFRGQNNLKRLRTKFHRTGRAELNRFVNEDIKTLHRVLSARTRHVFNLTVPDENGAFFNLVQHHGYPTPLLDWTYSPYVAAFFAYRGISNEDSLMAKESDRVRIFVFDQNQWRNDNKHSVILATSFPHLSIMEFMAMDNERVIPQQAVSIVTNIDDIESFISFNENRTKNKYLLIIDLPVKERTKVLRELSYMGIIAGSLFPGLDGACEELKEKFFEI
jgi:hypothetical protein